MRSTDAHTDNVNLFHIVSTYKDIYSVTDEMALDGFSILIEGQDSI